MEEWRDVVGYEGMYQVSNCGRIRSLDRISSGGHKLKGRVRPLMIASTGYVVIGLTKNGKTKYHAVHRLVAEAFIPNPNQKREVNHIDESRNNNNVENLEWVTRKENLHHGTAIERMRRNRSCKSFSKPVLQFEANGNFLRRWRSMEATREIGCAPSSISRACKSGKVYHGCKWEFEKIKKN